MAARGGSGRGRRVAVASSDPQQQRRETGPQTDKGQARRAELLIAARSVFEERGFLDARVADIVAEAEVAQGTFYSYFDSKDAVFREVVENAVQKMIDDFRMLGAEPGTPAATMVRAGLRRYLQVYKENARIIALMEQVGTFTPEMRQMRLRVREAWLARLERSLERQQKEGIADPRVDPRMIVQVLGAMADHTCYLWFSLGQSYEEDKVVDALTTVWARAIGVEDSTGWRTSGS